MTTKTATPLSIGMVSYYLPANSKIGAGYQAHGLGEALVRRGHDVTMWSPGPLQEASYRHVPVELTGRLRTFRWSAMVRKLPARDFDIFHAQGDDSLCWRTRPPHIRTMHGSCLAEARRARGRERVRMLALGLTEVVSSLVADETVYVSADTARYYPARGSVIPCGVDLGHFHPGPGRAEKPVVLFVGTYNGRKRGRLLHEQFHEQVLPRVPDAELWMVCSDAPESDRVRVLGRVSDEELASLYQRAWVFSLPSSYEGFGVPYIEAMASGLPVVATPNPGSLEVLQRGELGAVVAPESLGTTIADLLLDESRRESMSVAGLAASEAYDWDRVCERYESIYCAALDR